MIFLGDVRMIKAKIKMIKNIDGSVSKNLSLFISPPILPLRQYFRTDKEYNECCEEYDVDIHAFNRLYTGDVQLLQEI